MPEHARRAVDADRLRKMPVSPAEEPNPLLDMPQRASEQGSPEDPDSVEGWAEVEPGFTTTGPSGSSGGRALYGLTETTRRKPTELADEDESPSTDRT